MKRVTPFLFLLAVSVTFASSTESTWPSWEPFDPAKAKEVIDLRPTLQGMQLREGWNLLRTTPFWLRLSAQVQGGKIISFVAADHLGRQLATRGYRMRSRGPGVGGRLGEITCWVCVQTDIGRLCYGIDCTKLSPSN